MYGTIARVTPKAGQEAAVLSMMEEWDNERSDKVTGAQAVYFYKPDDKPDELVMVVVFRDKESYKANAEDPEQDRWFRRLRDLLQADPAWEDGEVLYSSEG